MNNNVSTKTRDLGICAIFIALITICSWISIPAPVPFTMQTFAVFLCAGLLGMKRSLISICVWIAAGFIGLPVFANFQGGPSVIFGPLGGYILGFIFLAIIACAFTAKSSKTYMLVIGMALGMTVCYMFGTLWFMYFYGKSAGAIGMGAALSMCVIPFIIPDTLKMLLAVFLTGRLKRFV